MNTDHGGTQTPNYGRLTALVLAIVMVFSVFAASLVAIPVVRANADEDGAYIDSLVIDKVYELTPVGEIPDGVDVDETGFAPEITDYTGTAYLSVEEIKVYPFTDASVQSVTASKDGAAVTVTSHASDGYYALSVAELGTYDIEITVKSGSNTRVYSVAVEKVNTDYRGRTPIYENAEIMENLSVTSDFEGTTSGAESLLDILKKDYIVDNVDDNSSSTNYAENIDSSYSESYWQVSKSNFPNATYDTTLNDDTEAGVNGVFTIDLGDVYSISRIRAIYGPNNLNLTANVARISVSVDGVNWETPISDGSMRNGGRYNNAVNNAVRYEFGSSYEARYIRLDVVKWSANYDLRVYQFMIFTDAEDTASDETVVETDESAIDETLSVPHQNEERHQYLSRAQATVIEFGLQVTGWVPSSGYGRGYTTSEEKELIGYSGPVFYDQDLGNLDYMEENPDSVWGVAKAPCGNNTVSSCSGEPSDFLGEGMLQYISNALSFGFGDEGSYSTSEAYALEEWFDWVHDNYPAVLTFTNQWSGQWSASQLAEYIEIAEPDILAYDDYYGDSSYASPGSTNINNNNGASAVRQLLSHTTWKRYRELAAAGVDGTGTKPFVYGQYLDAFAFNAPESRKNLVFNLSLLTGMKWLSFFRLEYQFDRAYFFDEDGALTRGALEWNDVITTGQALEEQLMRLNSTWIMVEKGTTSSNSIGMAYTFDSEPETNAEYGLSDLDVTNTSGAQDGKQGDVVVGYFDTLTGLYESEIAEYFAGSTEPKAFMLLNGLSDGLPERIDMEGQRIVSRESGSSKNTEQEITVTVDADFASNYTLYKVDTDDLDADGHGTIKEVELVNNQFTTTIGGGQIELYFWGINSSASASSAADGASASFAFDSSSETYWQPAETNDANEYTLEQSFDELVQLSKVTIVENGDNVDSFVVEYQNASGEWVEYAQGETINGATSVTYGNGLNGTTSDLEVAQGLRITFTATSGLPAIYTVEIETTTSENTLTVNDNTQGSGLYKFDYSGGIWSYREIETTEPNNTGYAAMYPLNYDGHFTNYANQTATFKFYGTGVTLLLRGDKTNNYIKARVLNENGDVVSDWQTGSGTSLVFSDLSSENQVYTLEIQTTAASRGGDAGIDGATVTYTGTISQSILQQYSDGSDAVQEYVDQIVTNTRNEHYFTYSTAATSVNGNAQSINVANANETSRWVRFIQSANYMNVGFTRTSAANASYTLTFTGTGVTLYSSSIPIQGGEYGSVKFTLDGEDVTDQVTYLADTTTLISASGYSVPMWSIDVDGATDNSQHTLEVEFTNSSGQSARIDYAVVDKYWSTDDSVVGNAYTVSTTTGNNGSLTLSGDVVDGQVASGGNVVVEITPNAGYQVASVTVNGDTVTVPESNRLTLTNVTENLTINVTFEQAKYTIKIDDYISGGTVGASIYSTTSGTTVTLTPASESYYTYDEGSLSVTTVDGAAVAYQSVGDGTYTFTMPTSDVEVTASFTSTLNEGDGSGENGGSSGGENTGEGSGEDSSGEGNTGGNTGGDNSGEGNTDGDEIVPPASSGGADSTTPDDDPVNDAGVSLPTTGASITVVILGLALLGAGIVLVTYRERAKTTRVAQHIKKR